MKRCLVLPLLLLLNLLPATTMACITCNQKIRAAIFDSQFYPNLLAMLSPFMVLGVLVFVFSRWATHSKKKVGNSDSAQTQAWVPLTSAATVLGIGLGGFVDGIVLHQLLQWHQMLSNKIAPVTVEAKSVNMFWDGIFHFFTLLVTLTGSILLWHLLQKKNVNRSGWLFSGGLLLGWAIFNIIEGIADHHILKLHNVREVSPDPNLWNVGFLIFSLLLGGVAGWMVQKGRKEMQVLRDR